MYVHLSLCLFNVCIRMYVYIYRYNTSLSLSWSDRSPQIGSKLEDATRMFNMADAHKTSIADSAHAGSAVNGRLFKEQMLEDLSNWNSAWFPDKQSVLNMRYVKIMEGFGGSRGTIRRLATKGTTVYYRASETGGWGVRM